MEGFAFDFLAAQLDTGTSSEFHNPELSEARIYEQIFADMSIIASM